MSMPELPPSHDWVTFECGNCGRSADGHWLDMCHPVSFVTTAAVLISMMAFFVGLAVVSWFA